MQEKSSCYQRGAFEFIPALINGTKFTNAIVQLSVLAKTLIIICSYLKSLMERSSIQKSFIIIIIRLYDGKRNESVAEKVASFLLAWSSS